MRRLVLLSAVLVVLPAASPQDSIQPSAAVAKGVRWLLGQKEEALKKSALELVVLTLASSDVDESVPIMSRLVGDLVRRPPETTGAASLRAMALRRLDPVKFFGEITRCAQFLVDAQCDNGQWDGGKRTADEKPRENPPRRRGEAIGGKPLSAKDEPFIVHRRRRTSAKSGDNVNSQLAAFGLKACMEAGVYFEKDFLARARGWWNTSQRPDGGWSDGGDPEDDGQESSNGGMTAAAIAATCIYKHFMNEDFHRTASVLKGWQWLQDQYSVKENPGLGNVAHFQYLLSLQRAAALLARETIGEHAWYSEGTAFLLSRQEADGHWSARDLRARDPIQNTCFAILFLRREASPLPPPVRIPPPPHPEEK